MKSVLYIEDDDNDVFLMQRAFRLLKIPNPLKILPDGEAAVAYISQARPHQNEDLPELTLIDLSMPGTHGLEVLRWIRGYRPSAELPIVVFSSSNQESDVERAYELGADGFIMKPGDPDQLKKVVEFLRDYWLSGERPQETFVDFAAPVVVSPVRTTPRRNATVD